MADKTLTLGERICLAARLCVEEHLLQSVTAQMSCQQHVVIGGAGRDQVTDDSLLLARGRADYFSGAARSAEGEVG